MTDRPQAPAETMRALCDNVTAALHRGELPPATLGGLKTAIDETRMRLWVAMEASKSGDPAWVTDFWLRRAAEVCLSLLQQVERGELDRRLPQAAELRDLAQRLATTLASGPK